MRFGSDALVVMAKYPIVGSVKTRLAWRIGAEWACRLYDAFLRDTARRFRAGPWQLVWAVDPPGCDLSSVVGAGNHQIDQQGPDLSERMRRCFETLLGSGAQRVVMLGADAPYLPDATLVAAFAALGEDDIAIAPSADGGYCLVGLRRPYDIFSGIAMSTAQVFEQTLMRATALGLRLRVLDASFDIDELDDVIALERLLKTQQIQLPHTAAVLSELRAGGMLRD